MPLVRSPNTESPFARQLLLADVPRAARWFEAAVSRAARDLNRIWTGGESSAVQDASVERLELIEELFWVKDVPRVEAILRQDMALPSLLLELCSRSQEVFGKATPLSLELVQDPEAEVEEPELFAIVHASGSWQHRLQLLNELDERWWRAASSKASGRMNVDVDLS